MKFLADQDVYFTTVQLLRGLGHDVVTAAERNMSQATDTELLQAAHDEQRLFITRDRDFGGLVFVDAFEAGVIYLRVLPSTLQAVHQELVRLLGLHDESDLSGTFVVVEPGRHRVRKPPP